MRHAQKKPNMSLPGPTQVIRKRLETETDESRDDFDEMAWKELHALHLRGEQIY